MINTIELILWYKSGLNYKEISEKLMIQYEEKISVDTIRKRINRNLNELNDDEKKEIKSKHKNNAKEIVLNKIRELYAKGATSVEIGELVGLESSTVNNYISYYCKDLRDEHIKNSKSELICKVTELYKQGFTTTEIGSDLGVTGSTVKNYTSNLSQDIKDEHEKNYKIRLDIRRENNKIFNQTNNKEMRTRQAVIQNRQSYYTDKKDGSLRFDLSRGALPCDLPLRYVAAEF